jgi:large subunit ribosomal protein L25
MFVIKAKKRNEGINLDTLRKTGEIPAVFYGTGETTTSISIPIVEFKKIWREAGESSTVKIAMGDNNIDVLIHEVQVNPVTEEPIHVDFLVVDMNKKLMYHLNLSEYLMQLRMGWGTLLKFFMKLKLKHCQKIFLIA